MSKHGPVVIGVIIAVALIIFILLVPAGEAETRFHTVYADDVYIIIVDMRTGVEYIRTPRGGITALIDSYGNPVLYPGFDAREDRTL